MVRLRRSKRPGRPLTVTNDFLPSTREGLATIQQRIADAHDQWADSIEGDVRAHQAVPSQRFARATNDRADESQFDLT